MSDENLETPKTAYPKTGLIIAATVLPVLGWAGRQIMLGVKNAIDGKSNEPPLDED